MPSANAKGIRLEHGDLVLTKGELELVTGLPNLAQALQIRVLTPLGTDRYDTRYGFDYGAVFTAPVSAQEMRDLVRLNLVRTIGTDPRVQDIRDIEIVDAGTDPRHRTWRVDVSITTSDGTPAVLTTTVGAPS
ncbi:hypothetical protein [Nocardia altamirensis]|uniref:hypothetical protein n=1 Tax=Nocardia altamirensis TaxID=472158 RepID=UPI00114D2AC4|nr:hypothetical protein [Nocardia altamirensis]